MKTLLRIDAGLRHAGSFSRTMGDYFVERWKKVNPGGNITCRDVNNNAIPHLNAELATAFFSGEKNTQILNLSNQLCNELIHCDDILITCPMYNYGIPSTLKTWLDHIVRLNQTFVYEHGKGHRGLLEDKKAYVVSSMGGSKENAACKTFENYLKAILGFIGIDNVSMVIIDGTATMSFSDNWQEAFQTQINQELAA